MLFRLALIGGGLAVLLLVPVVAEAIVATSSRRAVLHCLAADELRASGHLIPAEREFRRALELQPMLGAAHYGLGKIRFTQARYGEAVVEYRAAMHALAEVDRTLRGAADAPVKQPATLVVALAEALDAERASTSQAL
jgi:tetratricopeptide (TPR) repeat protein